MVAVQITHRFLPAPRYRRLVGIWLLAPHAQFSDMESDDGDPSVCELHVAGNVSWVNMWRLRLTFVYMYLRAGGVPTRHKHKWDGLHTRHLLDIYER